MSKDIQKLGNEQYKLENVSIAELAERVEAVKAVQRHDNNPDVEQLGLEITKQMK